MGDNPACQIQGIRETNQGLEFDVANVFWGDIDRNKV